MDGDKHDYWQGNDEPRLGPDDAPMEYDDEQADEAPIESVEWEASVCSHHEKGMLWWVVLAVGCIVLGAGSYRL